MVVIHDDRRQHDVGAAFVLAVEHQGRVDVHIPSMVRTPFARIALAVCRNTASGSPGSPVPAKLSVVVNRRMRAYRPPECGWTDSGPHSTPARHRPSAWLAYRSPGAVNEGMKAEVTAKLNHHGALRKQLGRRSRNKHLVGVQRIEHLPCRHIEKLNAEVRMREFRTRHPCLDALRQCARRLGS